jgi:hypothetical protein
VNRAPHTEQSTILAVLGYLASLVARLISLLGILCYQFVGRPFLSASILKYRSAVSTTALQGFFAASSALHIFEDYFTEVRPYLSAHYNRSLLVHL